MNTRRQFLTSLSALLLPVHKLLPHLPPTSKTIKTIASRAIPFWMWEVTIVFWDGDQFVARLPAEDFRKIFNQLCEDVNKGIKSFSWERIACKTL